MIPLALCLLATTLAVAFEPTEQDFRDAILGTRTFTQEQLQAMDLNEDGRLDVSDIVNYMQSATLPTVNFASSEQWAYEDGGTIHVPVVTSRPYSGGVRFTLGGSAEPNEVLYDIDVSYLGDYPTVTANYSTPDRLVLFNNTTSESVSIVPISNQEYEGITTIELNLAPGMDYTVGAHSRHTIFLQDARSNTTADFLLVLSQEMPGISRDELGRVGFPPTLKSQTARLAITKGEGYDYSAVLRGADSFGFVDTELVHTACQLTSDTLHIEFSYIHESKSFVYDSPLRDSFDIDWDNPQTFPAHIGAGGTSPKQIQTKIKMAISDFIFPAQETPETFFSGTFELTVSGGLDSGKTHRVEGTLTTTLLAR